tara:strand:+ start:158 stop:406 length:249 start_codon:yes stop_codon:yes gene_type:complete
MSLTSVAYIEILRSEWIVKRARSIQRIDELKNEGEDVVATALEIRLDTIQEIISDLTKNIENIKNIAGYERSCIELINNLTK